MVLSIFPGNDFNDIAKNGLIAPDGRRGIRFRESNPASEAIPLFRSEVLLRRALTGSSIAPTESNRLAELFGGDRMDILVDPDSVASRRKIRLMKGVLHMFKETLAEKGIGFFVFILPSEQNVQNDWKLRSWGIPRDAYFNNETIAEKLCEREKLVFLNLTKPFVGHHTELLFTPEEGRLSVPGVHLAIRFVSEMVRHHSSKPLPPRPVAEVG